MGEVLFVLILLCSAFFLGYYMGFSRRRDSSERRHAVR